MNDLRPIVVVSNLFSRTEDSAVANSSASAVTAPRPLLAAVSDTQSTDFVYWDEHCVAAIVQQGQPVEACRPARHHLVYQGSQLPLRCVANSRALR